MAITDGQQKQLGKAFERHGVAIAYLFGSQARDNAGPLSDIDIAVMFDKSSTNEKSGFKQYSDLRYSLAKILGENVDLVDLDEVKSPLLKHRAVLRGKLLYCSDTRRRQRLQLAVLHEYEDTRHLRETQAGIMRRQIREGTFGKSRLRQQ